MREHINVRAVGVGEQGCIPRILVVEPRQRVEVRHGSEMHRRLFDRYVKRNRLEDIAGRRGEHREGARGGQVRRVHVPANPLEGVLERDVCIPGHRPQLFIKTVLEKGLDVIALAVVVWPQIQVKTDERAWRKRG